MSNHIPVDLSIPKSLRRNTTPVSDDETAPEIRVEAYDKIEHWREKLDQTAKLKKRDVFERAVADLFLEAEYEHDLGAVQAIADAVYFLGCDHAALSDDDIQFVMVGAKARAKRESERSRTNGGSAQQTAAPIGDIPLTVDAWLARVLPDLDRIIGEWFFSAEPNAPHWADRRRQNQFQHGDRRPLRDRPQLSALARSSALAHPLHRRRNVSPLVQTTPSGSCPPLRGNSHNSVPVQPRGH
jgi:hypothetical protein